MKIRRPDGLPRDQAHTLRCLVQQQCLSRTLAVTSGKGGVGKTTVAVNLALVLAARGYRVVLLDADFGLANADLLLGVQTRFNLSHVLDGSRDLSEVLTEICPNLTLLPGASGVRRMANLSSFERHRLLEMFSRILGRADFLVLDCGAGISDNVITFAAAADEVIVVTTPEPPAIMDAYALIKVLVGRRAGGRVGLIVNLAPDTRAVNQTYERLARVAGQFLGVAVEDLGGILRDERVALAVQRRRPLVWLDPRCPASLALVGIARRLEPQPAVQRETAGGFLRRIVNLFV